VHPGLHHRCRLPRPGVRAVPLKSTLRRQGRTRVVPESLEPRDKAAAVDAPAPFIIPRANRPLAAAYS
jgi:hypothetical protein